MNHWCGYLFAVGFLVYRVCLFKKKSKRKKSRKKTMKGWRKKQIQDFQRVFYSLSIKNLYFEGDAEFVIKNKSRLKPPGSQRPGTNTFFIETIDGNYPYALEDIKEKEFQKAKRGEVIRCGIIRHAFRQDVYVVVRDTDKDTAIARWVKKARLLFLLYILTMIFSVTVVAWIFGAFFLHVFA